VLTVLVVVAVATRSNDARGWLLLGCILVPIAGAVTISIFKPLFVGRYLILALPPVAVLVGCGLTALRLPLRSVAAVALAVLLTAAIPTAYGDQHGQDWRTAGYWMADRTEPGDRMIAGNGLRPITYYLGRAGASIVPGSTTAGFELSNESHGRLWLVLTSGAANSPLQTRLSAAFNAEEQRAFGSSLKIVLLTPKSTARGRFLATTTAPAGLAPP
jgi:hypothetical protein